MESWYEEYEKGLQSQQLRNGTWGHLLPWWEWNDAFGSCAASCLPSFCHLSDHSLAHKICLGMAFSSTLFAHAATSILEFEASNVFTAAMTPLLLRNRYPYSSAAVRDTEEKQQDCRTHLPTAIVELIKTYWEFNHLRLVVLLVFCCCKTYHHHSRSTFFVPAS